MVKFVRAKQKFVSSTEFIAKLGSNKQTEVPLPWDIDSDRVQLQLQPWVTDDVVWKETYFLNHDGFALKHNSLCPSHSTCLSSLQSVLTVMLDGPVICRNNSFLFPYSQLFLVMTPGFHNGVGIITASQGSERALQIMEEMLPPLAGDASTSCPWNLQSSSLLGHWSYLPMEISRRRGTAFQGPKDQLGKLRYLKSFTQNQGSAHKWRDALNIIHGPPSWGRSPLLLNHYWCLCPTDISRWKFGPIWPLPRIASHTSVLLLAVQEGHGPCFRQKLFAHWHPFREAIRKEKDLLKQEVWTRWCLEAPSNLDHPVILWRPVSFPMYHETSFCMFSLSHLPLTRISIYCPHSLHMPDTESFCSGFTQTKVSYHLQLRTQSARDILYLSG